jgi:uncharacterized membrane protein
VSTSPGRIYAFDWLRGLAVVVMIQTHALVLLQKSLERDPFFAWLVRIDGLVAPSFIFSAGFALALVQVRVAVTGGSRKTQALKTLKRIGEVLLVASLVNTIWFQAWREPKWLFRLDILHCIGLALLIALPFLVSLASRPQVLRWVMLAMAALVFGLSPLTENIRGIASIFVNTQVGALDDTLGTTFPLFPWSGYVFLGASFGATVAMMKKEVHLWSWLALLWGLGVALWATDDFWRGLYPAHSFWVTNPANAAQRWTLVLSLIALLRGIEVKVTGSRSSKVAALIGAFGASSLSAYFFHEMLLYEHHVGIFTKLFRERCDWVTYWPVLAALVLSTWLCVKAWERVEPRLRAFFGKKPSGLTSS